LVGLTLALPVMRRRTWWPAWAVAGVACLWALLLSIALASGIIAAEHFSYLFNPLVIVFAMAASAAMYVSVAGWQRRYSFDQCTPL
jgi:hypothetical protein